MWLFLVQEVMFFAGLFLTFIYYRSFYPDAFAHASNHLNIVLGTFNTVVLASSSLTMALAVHAAQTGRKERIILFLLATLALGLLFLGVKSFEYVQKWEAGLVPGLHWLQTGPEANHQFLFFSLYFAMTGLHALHMVIGSGLLVWLLFHTIRGRYTATYNTPVELCGLYWHFVDIVWIFLFPLLYLFGRHAS